MDLAAIATQLRNHLDAEGRLVRYPSKRRLQMLALCYLAARFDAGRTYSEAEVNGLLASAHTFNDPATLRRDLYNHRFLERERDGSKYWPAEVQPTPADLGIEY